MGPQGMPGPQGLQGPPGPGGAAAALFAQGVNQAIIPGDGVFFSQTTGQIGTAVTKADIPDLYTSFTVQEDGVYQIAFYFQINRVAATLNTFYYDLYQNSPRVLLGNQLVNSLYGGYATMQYDLVVSLTAGQSFHVEFDGPANLNGTEHTLIAPRLSVIQLYPL